MPDDYIPALINRRKQLEDEQQALGQRIPIGATQGLLQRMPKKLSSDPRVQQLMQGQPLPNGTPLPQRIYDVPSGFWNNLFQHGKIRAAKQANQAWNLQNIESGRNLTEEGYKNQMTLDQNQKIRQQLVNHVAQAYGVDPQTADKITTILGTSAESGGFGPAQQKLIADTLANYKTQATQPQQIATENTTGLAAQRQKEGEIANQDIVNYKNAEVAKNQAAEAMKRNQVIPSEIPKEIALNRKAELTAPAQTASEIFTAEHPGVLNPELSSIPVIKPTDLQTGQTPPAVMQKAPNMTVKIPPEAAQTIVQGKGIGELIKDTYPNYHPQGYVPVPKPGSDAAKQNPAAMINQNNTGSPQLPMAGAAQNAMNNLPGYVPKSISSIFANMMPRTGTVTSEIHEVPSPQSPQLPQYIQPPNGISLGQYNQQPGNNLPSILPIIGKALNSLPLKPLPPQSPEEDEDYEEYQNYTNPP